MFMLKVSIIQAVKCQGVVTEKVLQFFFRTALNRPQQSFYPPGIFSLLIGHRPISTVHHSIKAKTFDDVTNIWLELLFGPMLMIGFRDQTRDFAPDVRKL